MDRITPKEVLSMMQAVAQVYEQPKVEQVDEVYSQNERKAAEEALSKLTPEDIKRLQKQQQDNPKDPTLQRIGDAIKNFLNPPRSQSADPVVRQGGKYTGPGGSAKYPNKTSSDTSSDTSSSNAGGGMTDAQIKAAQDAANRARRDGKMSDIRGGSGKLADTETETKPKDTKPKDTKPKDTKPKDTESTDTKPSTPEDKFADSVKNPRTIPGAMSYRSADGSGPGGYQLPAGARPLTSGNAAARVGATPVTPPTTPAATPAAATPAAKPRAQVRGREAMMAAQRDRARQSSQKPVATTPVTAPATPAAAKSKLSIADRLQQIRDMRARSQERIRQQGGTPATPAVTPTPKAAAPSTTGATTTPVAKVNKKQPLKNGDPMERMTGKGAASLMETYSKVYEEREPQAIDEGIMGALAKVGKVVAEEREPEQINELKVAPDYDGPPIKRPGVGDLPPKKKPEKPPYKGPVKPGAAGGKKPDAGPGKPPYQLPKRTPANAKNVEYYKDDVDLFDIIKGHLMSEGLTEEEALAKMFDLTDEERTEIIEGSCGSKKKSKKGGY